MSVSSVRYPLVDYLRLIAIILMVIYHINIDMYFMGIISREEAYHPLMIVVQRSCLSLFMFCVGYSLALQKQRYTVFQDYRHAFVNNWLKVMFSALLISVATYIALPNVWVYFGVLHCISLSMLVAIPFLYLPRIISALAGSAIMLAYWVFDMSLPWFKLQNQGTIDYIALFPWFGMVLLGIAAHTLALHTKLPLPERPRLLYISRHSLIFYLIHQPIIGGVLWLLFQLDSPLGLLKTF